jgi:hypothetical protein
MVHPYLIRGLGYTQKEASWITTLPWAAAPFIVVFAGWFSQHLLARGASTRAARGTMLAINNAIATSPD